MITSDLIQPLHLNRTAVVYVRQSSPQQVLSNQESQRMQYALTQRAEAFGWPSADVRVIDEDLGISASRAEQRPGFQELATLVSLDKVGLIIAFDATRLARNCTDWYQLLDLCGHRQCLIADADSLYDPASINGRLLLGLKGQIAELELYTIKARLTAGLVGKAQRGELALALPTGLMRLETGEVVRHPDREVQDRITLVFDSIVKLRSIAQVVRSFKQKQLLIPRRDRFGDIQWKRPTIASIGSMLKNPAYAGAYAYGRTRTVRSASTRRPVQQPRPMDQWRVLLKDRWPGYVSWDDFDTIQAMLRDNHSEYDRNKTRGVPREGKALLAGIVWCGECGHKMCVQYKGGTRYLCNHLRQQHGEPVCQYLPGDAIDDQVVAWFFEALSAAEIDLSARALADADRDHDRTVAALKQQVQRLQYRARLADRRFQQSDPDNRLVTAELERRWEQSLRELQTAEIALSEAESASPCWAIPADLLEALKDVGRQLPELWQKNLFSTSRKKSLLRSLIEKVVLHRDRKQSDHIMTRVVWKGGAVTESRVPVPVGNIAQLTQAKQMQEQIVLLARQGIDDETIAEQLTQSGFRSPSRSDRLLPSTVKCIRLRCGVMVQRSQSHPRRIPGFLTVPQLAELLGVTPHWLYDRIHNSTIVVEKDAPTGLFLFPDTTDTIERFRQLRAGTIQQPGS
jgi:DNA invertase Pin-like site-specific DNA recombinase